MRHHCSKFFLIGLICFYQFYIVDTQSCTCDLTTNQCDINCCCDADCTANEKSTFSYCIAVNKNRLEEVCLSSDLLYSINGQYQIEGNSGGLLCIYRDNYEERSLYPTINPITGLSIFQSFVRKYDYFSYAKENPKEELFFTSYKYGDRLQIIFSNNQFGYLSQPTTFLTEQCLNSNPAQFLNSSATGCNRKITNLQEQCNSQSEWNYKRFYEGFKVSPFPAFLIGKTQTQLKLNVISKITNSSFSGLNATSTNATSTNTTSTNATSTNETAEISFVSLYNSTELVLVELTQPLKCKLENGTIIDCPPDTTQLYNPSVGCTNVLHEINYTVYYETNITTKIKNVSASVLLGTVPLQAFQFQQTFTMKFLEKVVQSNVTSNITANVTKRSGNPGYIVGLPVLVGVANTSAELLVIKPSLTKLVKATANGVCDLINSKKQIVFGLDYKSGCFISVKNVMNRTECQSLQDEIYSNIATQLPTHIASFGNTMTSEVEDWVQIINKIPSAQPDVSSGKCVNIITDVTYQILFSKTGFSANPQNKIVGFNIKYGSPKNLIFNCHGIVCPALQRVEISQVVSFIDVSSTPQVEVKQLPKFKAKAPKDFFYPFF